MARTLSSADAAVAETANAAAAKTPSALLITPPFLGGAGRAAGCLPFWQLFDPALHLPGPAPIPWLPHSPLRGALSGGPLCRRQIVMPAPPPLLVRSRCQRLMAA